MTNKEAIEQLAYIKTHQIDPEDYEVFDLAIKALEEKPQGEWIKHSFNTLGGLGDWNYKCSECNKVYGGNFNFCPNCGADMRKGEVKND